MRKDKMKINNQKYYERKEKFNIYQNIICHTLIS